MHVARLPKTDGKQAVLNTGTYLAECDHVLGRADEGIDGIGVESGELVDEANKGEDLDTK